MGWCGRCGFPWNRVQSHTTAYTDTSGCFPLCEECWSHLSPEERLPYYARLMAGWVEDYQLVSDESYLLDSLNSWSSIKAAVEAGK